MKRYIELAKLRNKLEIVLFVNHYLYCHECTKDEFEMLFFTLQDELNELSKIYENAKDALEQCI